MVGVHTGRSDIHTGRHTDWELSGRRRASNPFISASDGRCIDEIFHEASQYDNPKVDYVDQITFSSIQIKFAFEFQGLDGEDLNKTIWAKQRKYCEIFVVAALCAKQRTACLQACQLLSRGIIAIGVSAFNEALVAELEWVLSLATIQADADVVGDTSTVPTAVRALGLGMHTYVDWMRAREILRPDVFFYFACYVM